MPGARSYGPAPPVGTWSPPTRPSGCLLPPATHAVHRHSPTAPTGAAVGRVTEDLSLVESYVAHLVNSVGDPVSLDLGAEADVVLMRQDPPFDLGYITATHLLERIADRTLVVNDPASVRNAPEKVFVLDYARFMPPTLVTRSLDEARAFLKQHGAIVVKPLHGWAHSKRRSWPTSSNG